MNPNCPFIFCAHIWISSVLPFGCCSKMLNYQHKKGGNMGTRPLGSRGNRLAVCASKQSYLTTDQPSDYNRFGLSLPRKSGSSQTIHTYKPYLDCYIFSIHLMSCCLHCLQVNHICRVTACILIRRRKHKNGRM